jgi:hypothetical protein
VIYLLYLIATLFHVQDKNIERFASIANSWCIQWMIKNVLACDELDVWENNFLLLYVLLISISKWKTSAIIIAYRDANGMLNKVH